MLVGFSFASCSRYVANSYNLNFNQTQVVLSEANYKILGQVSGEASGVGSKRLIENNAYADMVKNANLTGSQALIFVNYEKATKLGGYAKVVVTATKIEFVK